MNLMNLLLSESRHSVYSYTYGRELSCEKRLERLRLTFKEILEMELLRLLPVE